MTLVFSLFIAFPAVSCIPFLLSSITFSLLLPLLSLPSVSSILPHPIHISPFYSLLSGAVNGLSQKVTVVVSKILRTKSPSTLPVPVERLWTFLFQTCLTAVTNDDDDVAWREGGRAR